MTTKPPKPPKAKAPRPWNPLTSGLHSEQYLKNIANQRATADTNAALSSLPSEAYIGGLGDALAANQTDVQKAQAAIAASGGVRFDDAFKAASPQLNAAMIGGGGGPAQQTVGARDLVSAGGANIALGLGGNIAAAYAQKQRDLLGLAGNRSQIQSGRQAKYNEYLDALRKDQLGLATEKANFEAQGVKLDAQTNSDQRKLDSQNQYRNAQLSLSRQRLEIEKYRATHPGSTYGQRTKDEAANRRYALAEIAKLDKKTKPANLGEYTFHVPPTTVASATNHSLSTASKTFRATSGEDALKQFQAWAGSLGSSYDYNPQDPNFNPQRYAYGATKFLTRPLSSAERLNETIAIVHRYYGGTLAENAKIAHRLLGY
jgi:hypothetical protein